MSVSGMGLPPGFQKPKAQEDILDVFQKALVFNGVDGTTGKYGLAPMSAEKLVARIEGRPFSEKHAERKAL